MVKLHAAIKRIIYRLLPELEQRSHVPQLAKIVRVNDVVHNATSTPERPHWSADVQLISAVDYTPLPAPEFTAVTMTHTLERAPEAGALVVVQYINGSPHLPIITAVLPWFKAVSQRSNHAAELAASTTNRITLHNEQCTINAGAINQHTASHNTRTHAHTINTHRARINATGHITQYADGNYTAQSMGYTHISAGERLALTALASIDIATKADINHAANAVNTSAATTVKTTAKQNIEQTTEAELISIAEQAARLQAPKIHVGSEGVNVVEKLAELASIVEKALNVIAIHAHAPTGQVTVKKDIESSAENAGEVNAKVSELL
jgi:hypothetical protein